MVAHNRGSHRVLTVDKVVVSRDQEIAVVGRLVPRLHLKAMHMERKSNEVHISLEFVQREELLSEIPPTKLDYQSRRMR